MQTGKDDTGDFGLFFHKKASNTGDQYLSIKIRYP